MNKIKNWFIRGDTHGVFTWMNDDCLNNYKPEETAIIILGDAGFDWYLNKTDERKKEEVDARGYCIYWLRGNHEARPCDVDGYKLIYDDEVKEYVWCDERFPHLRALKDYGIYQFGKYTAAVIGGAYSVDKYWRLERAGMTEETNNPKKSGWFYNEQLTADEMHNAELTFTGHIVDFVFSHTCPYSWRPTDMFLSSVNQSTVDATMEKWLDELKDKFTWNVYCFGHYHADRLERPHVEQYYNDIETLDNIIERWKQYDETEYIDWWLHKSPSFYII